MAWNDLRLRLAFALLSVLPSNARPETLSVTTAFTEHPILRPLCALVVIEPSVCRDVPILRGEEIDWLLDRVDFGGLYHRVDPAGIEHRKRVCRTWPRDERVRVNRLLRAMVEALRTKGIRPGATILLHSRTTPFAYVAHEYAHVLFDESYESIRFEYRPDPDRPTMTDSLLEVLRSDPTRSEEEIESDADYYSRPAEEFPRLFEALAYRHLVPASERTFESFLRWRSIRDPTTLPPAVREYHRGIYERLE